ncbi:MAG: hypothetical protein AAB681_03540 [Patescibacteria group bacterium]
MDPNIDARLKGIEEKLEKNHGLLVRIRRTQKHGQYFKIFYWVLIILATFGAFYYIQPYLSQLIESYTGIQEVQQRTLKAYGLDVKNINEIIDQFKGIQE